MSGCYSQSLEPPAGLDVLPHPWKMLNSYSFWQHSIGHEQSLLQILHLSKQNRLSVPYSIHQYSMKPGHHKSPQNQTSSINPKSHTRHHGTNGHYTHVQQLPADVAKGLWHLQGLHQHHASAVFPWCWVQVGCTRRGKKHRQMCFFLQSHKYSALRLSTSDPPPLGLKWTNVNSQTLLCKMLFLEHMAISVSSMMFNAKTLQPWLHNQNFWTFHQTFNTQCSFRFQSQISEMSINQPININQSIFQWSNLPHHPNPHPYHPAPSHQRCTRGTTSSALRPSGPLSAASSAARSSGCGTSSGRRRSQRWPATGQQGSQPVGNLGATNEPTKKTCENIGKRGENSWIWDDLMMAGFTIDRYSPTNRMTFEQITIRIMLIET